MGSPARRLTTRSHAAGTNPIQLCRDRRRTRAPDPQLDAERLTLMCGRAAGCDRVLEVISTLPAELGRSITWDQGKEMAHARFTIATGIPVYFCALHKPWQL